MTWKQENLLFLFFGGLSLCLTQAPYQFAPQIGLVAAAFFAGAIIANTKINRRK